MAFSGENRGHTRTPTLRPWPRLTLFFLAFLLLTPILLAPRPAQAFRLGEVDIEPTLDISGTYDDNIFLTEQNTPGRPLADDFIFRLLPALSLAYGRGPTQFSVRYQNEFLFYVDFPVRDARGGNHGVDLAVDHAFGRRTTFSVVDTMRIGTYVPSIVDTGPAGPTPPGILPQRRDYRNNTLTLEAAHALTRRLTLLGQASYSYRWYGATGPGPTPTGGQTEDNLADVRGTLVYALTRSHAVTGTIGFSYSDYEVRGTARFLTFAAGYRGQPAEPLSLEASLGLQYAGQDFYTGGDTNLKESSVNPFLDMAITYTLGDLSARIGGSVGLADSSGIGGAVLQRQARASLDYRPWDPLVLSGSGVYTKSDSTSDDPRVEQDLEAVQAGFSGTYRLATWASARLYYSHIDQTAIGVSGATYKDNRVVLGFLLSLPGRF